MVSRSEAAKWDQYKYFKRKEFDCKHTGENHMKHFFMLMLEQLREEYGFPIVVSSGYRDATHPEEADKDGLTTGAHTKGVAVDIVCSHSRAYKLLQIAMKLGFTGIGIKQKGSGRYIHLDCAENTVYQPRPHVWSY